MLKSLKNNDTTPEYLLQEIKKRNLKKFKLMESSNNLAGIVTSMVSKMQNPYIQKNIGEINSLGYQTNDYNDKNFHKTLDNLTLRNAKIFLTFKQTKFHENWLAFGSDAPRKHIEPIYQSTYAMRDVTADEINFWSKIDHKMMEKFKLPPKNKYETDNVELHIKDQEDQEDQKEDSKLENYNLNLPKLLSVGFKDEDKHDKCGFIAFHKQDDGTYKIPEAKIGISFKLNDFNYESVEEFTLHKAFCDSLMIDLQHSLHWCVITHFTHFLIFGCIFCIKKMR